MKQAFPRPRPGPDEVIEINRSFQVEARKYGLRFRCADCVHGVSSGLNCSLRFPNAVLAEGVVRALDDRGEYVFCKDFELQD